MYSLHRGANNHYDNYNISNYHNIQSVNYTNKLVHEFINNTNELINNLNQ